MVSDRQKMRVLTILATEIGVSVERLESHPVTAEFTNPDSLELVEMVAKLRDAFQRGGIDEVTPGDDGEN